MIDNLENEVSNLTNSQKKVYDFVKYYISKKGFPPAVREICDAVSLSSTSTVHAHLKTLERKGLIKRESTKPRAMEIVSSLPKQEFIHIPVVGKITAGLPILAVENIEEHFSIPINFVKNNNAELFILKVYGESMIDAGIFNNDLAIIEKCDYAENGEIVVALIDNSATIKRFFKEQDHIRLQPENKSMLPIIVDDCKIIGKLSGLYRNY